jgi:hypothetical protein
MKSSGSMRKLASDIEEHILAFAPVRQQLQCGWWKLSGLGSKWQVSDLEISKWVE